MPRLSPAIDSTSTILRTHGTRLRLREGHDSRWLSVYENCPGHRVREGSARGDAARADRAVEELCNQLLQLAQSDPGAGLDGLLGGGMRTTARPRVSAPCWPEICDLVVTYQRGKGVNMNLVGDTTDATCLDATCLAIQLAQRLDRWMTHRLPGRRSVAISIQGGKLVGRRRLCSRLFERPPCIPSADRRAGSKVSSD